MQRKQSRADRLAEIESAQFVLSTRGGTAAGYDLAIRVLDHHLSPDSRLYWQHRYNRRMEELCQY